MIKKQMARPDEVVTQLQVDEGQYQDEPTRNNDFPESINTFGYLIMSLIGTVSCLLITK